MNHNREDYSGDNKQQLTNNALGPQITQFWGNWITVVGEILNAVGQTQQLQIDARATPQGMNETPSLEALYKQMAFLQQQMNQLQNQMAQINKDLSRR